MKEEVTVPRINSYELGKNILTQNVVKGGPGHIIRQLLVQVGLPSWISTV